ncbi:MAG: hypothetical protein PF484_01840 [Bacteroidales bacterium]|jgi:hypothetical protein|nr:hypothetical protein [Bacteroidales bacterium]
MSTQSTNSALALHEILLSISDSLNEAQNQLRNMPPYDEFGRPNTLYQLPYLDFSLEVISETASAGQNGSNNISSGIIKKVQVLKFTPVQPNTEGINSVSNKITSTISGRFVAIMPNEGLPQVFLSLNSVQADSRNEFLLTAKLQLATGEPVVGQKVEINYDLQNSLALNNNVNLKSNPSISPGKEGFTNSTGEFNTKVAINNALTTESYIFVANSGAITKSIAINKS